MKNVNIAGITYRIVKGSKSDLNMLVKKYKATYGHGGTDAPRVAAQDALRSITNAGFTKEEVLNALK